MKLGGDQQETGAAVAAAATVVTAAEAVVRLFSESLAPPGVRPEAEAFLSGTDRGCPSSEGHESVEVRSARPDGVGAIGGSAAVEGGGGSSIGEESEEPATVRM